MELQNVSFSFFFVSITCLVSNIYGPTSLFFLSNVLYFLLPGKKLRQSSHNSCQDEVNLKQIITAKKESQLQWAMADPLVVVLGAH